MMMMMSETSLCSLSLSVCAVTPSVVMVARGRSALAWAKVNGRKPDVRSDDPIEKRYAEILLFLQRKKQEREAAQRATEIVDEP